MKLFNILFKKPQKTILIEKGQKPITVFVDPPRKKLDDKASQTEKTNKDGVDVDALLSGKWRIVHHCKTSQTEKTNKDGVDVEALLSGK